MSCTWIQLSKQAHMKNPLHCIRRSGLLILLFSTLLLGRVRAQHFIFGNEKARMEIGLNFGPTFFLGDLGGGKGYGSKFIKDINLEVTKMMKGVFVTYYPNEWIGFRAAAQYTFLEGRDNLIKTNGENEMYRKQRNLDFKSNVWEAFGAMELYPLSFFKRNDEEYNPRWKPYGFAGVGVYHFNPKGSLTDQSGNVTWHELKPLHTEGQGFADYPGRKNYSLTQMNIPMGMGLKYMASERMNVGLELLYRKTFTDYIDDVSTTYIDPADFDRYLPAADAVIARQIADKLFGPTNGLPRTEPGYQRGNPKNNDSYFSVLLKIGFRIGDGDGSSSSERSALRKVRCPRF